MKKVEVLLLVLMLFSTSMVYASGLAMPEQGAAAMGLSAAVTARSEDLSAIFYNPAGIDYVENFDLMFGLTPIIPSHEYHPFREQEDIFSSIESESKTFLPPQIYAAWRAKDNMVIGLGVYAPFGLGTEWDEKWDGRYTSTLADVQNIHITPTIAYTVNEMVSIGLGVSYITSKATMEKMVDTGGLISPALAANTVYDSKFAFDGDGSAFNFNIGTIIRPIGKLQLGVSYRSAFDIDYDVTAKFTHKDTLKTITLAENYTAYDEISTEMPLSQDGTATLNMPWMLNFGLKYDVSDVWDTSFDIDFVGWSVYEKLVLDLDKDKPKDKITFPKDWENSFILRGGTTFKVNESFVARGGVMFDKNPVPDETFDGQLPDSNRWALSIGAGYKLGMMQLDASYMLLKFFNREKENAVGIDTDYTGDGIVDRFDIPVGYPVGNGKYKGIAHLFSASASFKF
ncbi:MAG TPA: hypothetical protein ENH82_04225 [bacterium]|nr:hypothetical protein [bacterium]